MLLVSHGMTITTFDLSHRSKAVEIGLGQRRRDGFDYEDGLSVEKKIGDLFYRRLEQNF